MDEEVVNRRRVKKKPNEKLGIHALVDKREVRLKQLAKAEDDLVNVTRRYPEGTPVELYDKGIDSFLYSWHLDSKTRLQKEVEELNFLINGKVKNE
jgi:hypothetical protein